MAKAGQAKISGAKYGRLLAAMRPSVISSEAEYDRLHAAVGKLLKKGDQITPEEDRLLDLLSALIEQYDHEHHPVKRLAPNERLRSLMREHELKPKDLLAIFGTHSRVSEALSGKRPFSKRQAKLLAERFALRMEAFI